MKPSQDIKPVTYMKTKSAELIKTVTTKRTPLIITQNGEAKVVIQDIQTYERERTALLLLKLLSQGITEAEQERFISQDEMFQRLEKYLLKLPIPSPS